MPHVHLYQLLFAGMAGVGCLEYTISDRTAPCPLHLLLMLTKGGAMSGSCQHAPQTIEQSTPVAQRVQEHTQEVRPTSRCGITRRHMGVARPPLALHIPIPEALYLLPLAALELSVRVFLIFQRAGIETVGQVLEMDLEDFGRLKLGEKSLEEVVRRMQALDVLKHVEELTEENLAGEEDPPSLPSCELLEKAHTRFCYEVAVSCLPAKFRDRVARRKPSCWVGTPVPSTIRPGYFLVRIGSTPEQLRDKRPVEVSEEEAVRLSPVSQVKAPTMKVAPAFLLPEHLRRAISSGISHPVTSQEWEGQALSITQQGAKDEMAGNQRAGVRSSPKVPIPQHIARMAISRLGLSLPLAHRLQMAGITRVGQILEMPENALRALSIGGEGLREVARCLQAAQVLPATEAWVYDEVYLAVTEQGFSDESGDQWTMVHVSAFPDRLPGEGMGSGLVHTLWMLQEHLDQAMDWDREHWSHLDTHTLRILVNEHARAQGAVAPPSRTKKRKRADEEQGLSASTNLFIPREATEHLLDALPPGQEERRSQERRDDQIFGVLQEEWLALARQAVARERMERRRSGSGQRQEALNLELVEHCIEQVEDWYNRLRRKPRILGVCGVFVEDRLMRERTCVIREKGKKARQKTIRWMESVPRLVGYHLVVGAPEWVIWPENWVQKPRERGRKLSA
jgi:hypothetical protein